MSGNACIFCRIAKKEIASRIVYEDERIIAFEDIKPQAKVHCLVIPKRHIERVTDLERSDVSIAGELVIAAKEIAIAKGLKESGYRMVINCNKDAGQDVFHIHLHLLGGRKFAWPPG
jgi:histidine triad (HIT) family protein